uniref:Endoplasmic reticulum vesicle transporter N-terminal domain-containing protein n=1 Tax=Corethron hystrix TaxID=216773 RepID=A0A7S1FZM6_9STRA|mmetsp:Transcript_39806/g.93278  ORF Transcript_39806/g.93278 Transcript_39806/m.93278 type:complete len:220 (+) Transcript_39806:48-707(+)
MSGINLADRLKRYDAHTAVSDEFRARTTQGASLSILAVLSALYFLTTELRYNFETTVVDRVYVNSTSSATAVQMEFDVVFPEIACGLLGVDANDAVGNSQGLHIDRTHHVYKHRLDNHGRPIHRSKPEKVGLGGTVTSDRKLEEVHAEKRAQGDDDGSEIDDYFESDFCGDCYSAGEPGECCNTCDDVKRAYRKKGWTLPNQKSISQCKNTIKAKGNFF